MAGADVAVVCGPVVHLPALVEQTVAASSEGCAVTDVGSTKSRLVSAAASSPRFVGGHPVCGSEARGVANARADLFQGATWFLTPTAATDPAHHRTVHGFVAGLGARPVAIDPGAHDRLVAITSHLPHAVANVLANQAGAGRVDGHDPLGAVGGSFRDMTRVAGANPRIWVDIFLDNREALLDGLREHGRRVEELARALEREDAGFLARWIGEAAGNRRRLLEAAYETVPEELYRVRVRVLDRPGVLSGHHAGARRRGHQHRGLRAPPHVGGRRRHGGHRGGRRGRGPPRGRPARRPGLRRGRDAGGRGMSDDGLRIGPAGGLTGELAVPGDKSVSHRAVLLGAISSGSVHVRGFGASADTLSTVAAVEALGVEVERVGETELVVHGVGLRGPRGPGGAGRRRKRRHADPAAARASWPGRSATFELTGDASIRSRPMERIAEPLRQMGVGDRDDRRPAADPDRGRRRTDAISYELPVASAQVKSCVLLAGLYTERGVTEVREPIPTRDHTERMLRAAGVPVDRTAGRVAVSPVQELRLGEIDVPGDFSSAAPFIVAATALSGSNLTLRDVGVNPTRTGLLTVMERMGARVGVFRRRLASGEPVADIEVRPAELVAADVEPELVPLLVDELPLVALLACFAHGVTTIRGAAELRVKESDRITATADALNAVGGHVEPLEDGFRIRGVPTRLRGGSVDAAGDHRVAMLGAVAGLCSQEGVEVHGADVLGVSFPDFADRLAAVSA